MVQSKKMCFFFCFLFVCLETQSLMADACTWFGINTSSTVWTGVRRAKLRGNDREGFLF